MIKIGVFGDSFAQKMFSNDDVFDESWMAHIGRRGYNITTHGMGGTSCWYSYKKFLEHYKEYTHIVFVYSSTTRANNLPDDLATFSNHYETVEQLYTNSLYQQLSPEKQQQLLTILEARKYSRDEVLEKFIAQSVFDNVNRITKANHKTIVNVLPFVSENNIENIDLSNRLGDCITDLVRVSAKEMPGLFRRGKPDPRRCHFSLENNMVLGDMVIESLTSRDLNVTSAMESGRFVYTNDITKRYFNMIKE